MKSVIISKLDNKQISNEMVVILDRKRVMFAIFYRYHAEVILHLIPHFILLIERFHHLY